MRWPALSLAALLLTLTSLAWDRQPPSAPPDQFEIGRRTFWDFGPPFNYYDLFLVRPSDKGSTVERIILTPPANECFAPAKIEVASTQINDSPGALLGSMNLCMIPEKELRRNPRGCKHCQRYSGADVALRVRCGTRRRVIPAHVFEDYWFDPHASPPKNTSSILRLLKTLDDAIGPGVMDKPIFDLPDDHNVAVKTPDLQVLEQLREGEFDDVFTAGPEKPSDLYRAAQNHPPAPSVRLLAIAPYEPESSVLPGYPPLARAASVEGQLTFTAEIDSEGTPTNVVFASGHPLLRPAVHDALTAWKFPRDAANHQIRGRIEFLLNCHVH